MLADLSDTVVFVIDSYSVDKFIIAKETLFRFVERNKFMKKKNLCVMFNKADLKNRPPKELLYKALEADKLQKFVGKIYTKETSAYNKEGLDECLDWMVKNANTI